MDSKIVKSVNPFPSGSKFVVLGAGFSGQRVAALSRKLGVTVLCSRRSMEMKGVDFIFNSSNNTIPEDDVLKNTTHLLSCIPPSSTGQDPVLINLKEQLLDLPLKWAGYLSTTGVYGDYKGAWVSESSPTKPGQSRSQRRLNCEKDWENSGLPVQILRLPGIYGPGRSAIESMNTGKSKMIDKPEQVFSRIHVDDIAGAVIHLIDLWTKGQKPKIINISDDLPTSNIEVLTYAARLLRISLPPIEPFHIAAQNMSPMALSFWEENRRVSNQKLCKDLGYSLIHSTYKSGLKNCLEHFTIAKDVS